MLQRKIEKIIRNYLSPESTKILIVNGARQVGKSFIIEHIGRQLFKNFIKIDMYEDKNGLKEFANISGIQDFYIKLSARAGKKLEDKTNTLVFIDEIQAYPELLTLLKFLKDDNRFTYIVSGSLLGITLNETLSKPGGRIKVEQMYPLDFEEFLWANDFGQQAIDHIKDKFKALESLDTGLHNKVMELFKKYLLVGGLPDAVNNYISTYNIVDVRNVQDEILSLYREDAAQYDKEHSLKIKRLYELIPSNLENKKKRVLIKNIEPEINGKIGFSRYQDEFDYLVNSGIALDVDAISNPVFPLIETQTKNLLKLYLNDVGLFTNILYRYNVSAVLNDLKSINLGAVYETVVATELKAHNFKLYYYDNKQKGEVDFLIDDYDSLSILPLEIKSGRDYTIHSAVTKFTNNKEYNVKHGYVLSNEREVTQDGNITYIPIYYIMCLQPSNPSVISIR